MVQIPLFLLLFKALFSIKGKKTVCVCVCARVCGVYVVHACTCTTCMCVCTHACVHVCVRVCIYSLGNPGMFLVSRNASLPTPHPSFLLSPPQLV